MKTWRERIAEARERGRFTENEIDMAGGSWRTCAVGEQMKAMPNVVTMNLLRPADEVMFQLGNVSYGFGAAVKRHDFAAAERLLDAIEDRALQLKRESR